MANPASLERPRLLDEPVLLGDEAVALAALHSGISAAYGYPGTPSTEILEFLIRAHDLGEGPRASWTVNEKTAYEQALGVSLAGKRVLVTMKHVGLNVAADPFINSALVAIDGGLVIAVADDPGMHSSQNEQDSRYLADLARIPCLEPSNQQEAYDMTRQAFDLSERFRLPVMIRLVTRLAHSRSAIRSAEPVSERILGDESRREDWILLPARARMRWQELLQSHEELRRESDRSHHNRLLLNPDHREVGVITSGIAINYFLENSAELDYEPPHLHIGRYPIPTGKIRRLADGVDALLVLEEGYPFVESFVRGVLPTPLPVWGKGSGHLPPDGELTPDLVRWALGLAEREGVTFEGLRLPPRPPRLCRGCPHCDAFEALNKALSSYDHDLVTSDIGCYTLGVLPPYSVGESCVCMGASIGMAVGAAESGVYPVVAVIGDSTFLHSGVTPLIDAVRVDADMTVLILDNESVGMTGAQPSALPSARLLDVVRGLGVDPDHCHLVESHPRRVDGMADLLGREIAHHGLSVVIAARECLESVRKRSSRLARDGKPR